MTEIAEIVNRTCRERCEFKANNCWMNEDGTWDCSIKFEDCAEHCRINS